MELTPLRGKVLCREVTTDPHYQGSPILLLPDRIAQETSQQAEVVRVGEEVHDPRLVPGVWVLHDPFRRVAVPTTDYFLLGQDDIVAILE